ncbi:MAG: TIR domain-containing protein [Lentisphaeria bacterium]|nr:TIR domain-containing protein [Lentisphaeria bacterium]
MAEEIRCPKCGSENIVVSRKRGAHVCEDCDHAFQPEKPFAARRIFISYGHDEHVSLAIRLRDDLRGAGHKVWFDEERLQPGHDWEAFIEKGLEDLAADKAHSAVVLLLTPHSVRRPDGYCLNEVARALGRGLRIIPLMVVESEPPLSICRIQWLDMTECIPISDKETLYVPKLARLRKAIEEDQLDFEGTQSRLLRVLQPIQFSADIAKLLRHFTGRQWVIDEIDAWLRNAAGRKVFWITGAPGVGKSAIAAWMRDHRREIAAFHFCDAHSEEKRNPGKLVRSVVYQLSTQLPEYQERLARLSLETQTWLPGAPTAKPLSSSTPSVLPAGKG